MNSDSALKFWHKGSEDVDTLMSEKAILENNTLLEPRKPLSAVLIMVCIYMFLVIERPWESIRYLEDIPIERVFAIAMIIVAFLNHKFKIVSTPTNKWVYGLLLLHFVLSPFAFNTGDAVDQGIEYAKMVVLYLLMLSVADDEESLKILVKVFVFSMMFYMVHSLWEYHNGRMVWRMGITRMVGVDSTFSDPNSFGASVVLSLPYVYALLRSETGTWFRRLYFGYFFISVICVILTGSRTSFVALLSIMLIWALIQQGKRKIIVLSAAVIILSVMWASMPEEKQNRIRTLWNSESGPSNAQESAEGRMLGWKASLKMFKQVPFTGVGAGGKNYIGYRVINRIDEGGPIPLQAHVLYGEVLAEFGIVGAILFIGLIVTIGRSCIKARSRLLELGLTESFPAVLGGAILCSLILLLIFGISGHNFYRPLWLWLAAWASTTVSLSYYKTDSISGNHENCASQS